MRRDFHQFLWSEAIGENITIDLSKYEKIIQRNFKELEQWSQNQADKLQNFKFDPNVLADLARFGYPKHQELTAALTNNTPDLNERVKEFVNWYIGVLKSGDAPLELRNVYQYILDQQDASTNTSRYNTEGYAEAYKQMVTQTQQNMEKLQGVLQKAIAGIPDWNGSPVKIEARYHSTDTSDVALEPADDASITVGSRWGSFTLFQYDGKMDIDDVIEGGFDEEDFFASNQEKSDYYNLINELRNPGSTQKGKVLTLYTARPAKDREYFEKAKALPVNLFLTTNFSRADGIASDLGGSAGRRDIWKVRIDSKYLTVMLDNPTFKDYMVSVDQAPVVSMDLY
jgi:hypothetical protein